MTETAVEPTDILEPNVTEYKTVIAKGTEDELILTQKPLTFFGKMEFFSVMSKAIDRAISQGLSVADLFDAPTQRDEKINASSFKEADLFVRAVVKLLADAPELLQDLIVVICAVPRGQREYTKMVMEGSLTDEQGIAILDHFVDQNWDVMTNFFKEQINPLVNKVGGKFQGSTSSKPLKDTRQNTRKQSKKS